MLKLESVIKELLLVLSYAKMQCIYSNDFRLFIQYGTTKIKKGGSTRIVNVVCTGWFHYISKEEKDFAHSINNTLLFTEEQVFALSPLSLESMLPCKLINKFNLKSQLRLTED